MRGLPGVVVTIDGRDGVGKTTLGRYLAWHFNVTLIETDLFLTRRGLPHPPRRSDQPHHRTSPSPTPLPVIVEGVSMLQLMQRMNRVADFSIYLTNPRRSSSQLMERRLSAYEATFAPAAKADAVVEIDLHGA